MITLPVTTAPAPVQAVPVAAKKPVRKPSAKSPVRPATAATLVARTVPTTPAVVRHTVSRPRTTVRSALLTRIVRSQAVRAALLRAKASAVKHERPPDPALPTASPAPAPAPAPTPPASAPAPAPAPAAAPAATTSQPTIVAAVEQPVAPTGDGLQQPLADHPHGDDGGHIRDRGPSPWDGGFGGHGHDRGR